MQIKRFTQHPTAFSPPSAECYISLIQRTMVSKWLHNERTSSHLAPTSDYRVSSTFSDSKCMCIRGSRSSTSTAKNRNHPLTPHNGILNREWPTLANHLNTFHEQDSKGLHFNCSVGSSDASVSTANHKQYEEPFDKVPSWLNEGFLILFESRF